jgi:hypothetical protein
MFDAIFDIQPQASLWLSIFLLMWLWAGRNRVQKFGTVFDSSTGHPLSHAVVTAIRDIGGVARTTITDRNGRYRLFIPGGAHHLSVSRAGYTFPSGLFKKRKRYGRFTDLYRGESLFVHHNNPLVVRDIPMDAIYPGRPSFATRTDHFVSQANKYLPALLILLTTTAAVRSQDVLLSLLGIIEVPLLAVTRFMRPWSSRRWYTVRNSKSGRVVPYARVDVIDKGTSKVIDTQVTDIRGRYGVLAPAARDITMSITRKGYLPYASTPLGVRLGTRTSLVGMDVKLEPDPLSTPETRGEVPVLFSVRHDDLEKLLEGMERDSGTGQK